MSGNAPTQSIAELITEFNRTTGDIPPLIIGASVTLVNKHIYVFGGRLLSNRQISNRLYILSLETMVWKIAFPNNTPPIPRYFHSANAQNDTHIIFYGGMTVKQRNSKVSPPINELATLDDLIVLNIKTFTWEYPNFNDQTLPPSRYAHISTLVNDRLIVVGGQDIHNNYLSDINIFDCKKRVWCEPISSQQFQYGVYRSSIVGVIPTQLTPPFAPNVDLLSDPFDESAVMPKDTDIDIHIYSNYSTSETTRQLHSWKLNSRNECIEASNQEEQVGTSTIAPPPLRFPSAFMCGQQFILAGPYINGPVQQFQIWALDMTSFVWSKIESGPGLSRGSWLRGMLCETSNTFLVFGHPGRIMQDDYKNRVHCFEYLACVDIEVFGIYRPPQPSFSTIGQSLGLSMLKDSLLADVKIVTTDSQTISANSAVLAQRWPLVRSLLGPTATLQEQSKMLNTDTRTLSFPDTHIVLIAFLQFIYTDHLVTAQQHQPQILSRLLFLGDLFKITRLKELAIHALHQMLNMSTAAMIYESASLSNATSLQIRALRVLINAKKIMQRKQKMQQVAENPISQSDTTQNTHVHHTRLLSNVQNEPINPYSTSKPLQKQDIHASSVPTVSQTAVARNSNDNTRYLNNGSPFSPPQSVVSFSQRSLSDRSMTTDSQSSYSGAPLTPVSSRSLKLTTFLGRQSSQLQNVYSDQETSPILTKAPSPKLSHTQQQQYTENLIKNSNNSKTHFWRHNTVSTKKKTKLETRTFGFSLNK